MSQNQMEKKLEIGDLVLFPFSNDLYWGRVDRHLTQKGAHLLVYSCDDRLQAHIPVATPPEACHPIDPEELKQGTYSGDLADKIKEIREHYTELKP